MNFTVNIDGEKVTASLPTQDELNKFSQALTISEIEIKGIPSSQGLGEFVVQAQGDWRDIFRAMSLASRDEALPPDQT